MEESILCPHTIGSGNFLVVEPYRTTAAHERKPQPGLVTLPFSATPPTRTSLLCFLFNLHSMRASPTTTQSPPRFPAPGSIFPRRGQSSSFRKAPVPSNQIKSTKSSHVNKARCRDTREALKIRTLIEIFSISFTALSIPRRATHLSYRPMNSPPSSVSRALGIVECLDAILAYLDPQDLQSCCLVRRQWTDVSRRYLFRDLCGPPGIAPLARILSPITHDPADVASPLVRRFL